MQHPRNILFALVPVLLFAVASAGQQPSRAALDCIFEHYSSEDGLPHNSIADIHQDRNGYIWLCTWYGLSRFDGRSFVNFTMLPGDYANTKDLAFLKKGIGSPPVHPSTDQSNPFTDHPAHDKSQNKA